ncbi:helix-turn-helix transcriptional regulator [Cryptosporangium aurantiacum]|uniref:Transcriptional regulator n=1 Tax=Cryptosporangium aurantiacum TaxID=134849 RepID=A0A1M7RAN5_9ACTN|nr:LuxR family transcriptional regulator [Cryptosporangium aurantiacum]SHN43357.1 transcriptional regulator [Cryptosporangium aurantiacum]
MGLIGRARELAHVSAVLERSRTAAATLVVVGEAGIGKTALLLATRDRARADGRTVLTVSCADTDRDDAYGALRRLLAPTELSGLFDGAAPVDPLALRHAILALLGRLASRNPVLLLVDDVQNADRDSLRLLALVLRSLRRERVAVVLAARDVVPPLIAAETLPFGEPGPVCELGPLSAVAAAALLDRQPTAPHGWARGEILRQSDGNPLAVVELSRAVGATGDRTLEATGPLPDGRLHRAFAAQLRAVPEPTRRLLLYAAAAWGRDSVWTILAAAGTPDDLRDWEPAEDAGLVTIAGDQVRFRHPLLRTTCYAEASEGERAQVHRDLAAQADDAYQRVWHLAAATPGPDESVAALLEDAAASAAGRGGFFEATEALQRAAERSPADEDAARRYAKAVYTAYRAGDPSWAVQLSERVDALTRTADTRGADVRGADVRGVAACGAALALTHAAQWNEAFALATRVVHDRPGDGQVGLTAVTIAATAALFSGVPAQRAALPRLLSAVDPGHGGPLGETMIPLPAIGVAAAFVRAVADPAGYADRNRGRSAASLAAPTSGLAEVARLLFVGSIAWLGDDTALTIATLRAVLAGQRQIGSFGSVAVRSLLLIQALIDAGQWAEATAVLDEAESFAAVGDMTLVLAAAPPFRATIAALRGQVADASAFLGTAPTAPTGRTDRAGQTGPARRTDPGGRADPEGRADAAPRAGAVGVEAADNALVIALRRRAAGLTAMAARDHDAAYRHLRALFAADGRPLHDTLSPRSLPQLAWCAVRTGRRADLDGVLAACERVAGPRPTARLAALLHHARALLSDEAEAEEHFRAALGDPMHAQHWPLEYAEAQLGYAEWLRKRRRPAEATPLLGEAADAFEHLGAEGHAEQARRHLRAGSSSTAASRFDRLTAQQQQIVRLAADGLTNQQIGERLSISARTVGSHLYRIYPVLEVASRHQLPDVLPTS